MAVIWGFDLSKMRWGAFSGREMYSRKWYMRRERIILNQLAMNICLAAECTATYSLAKYSSLQSNISTSTSAQAQLHHTDIYSTQVLTIVFCVLVATIYGADLFFLIFWPERKYPRWYNYARVGVAAGVLGGVGGAVVGSTVVVARHAARISGVDSQTQQQITELYYRPPLVYRTWPVNIAYVVVLWVGLVFTSLAFIAMYLGVRYEGHSHSATGSGTSGSDTDTDTVRPLPGTGYDDEDEGRREKEAIMMVGEGSRVSTNASASAA